MGQVQQSERDLRLRLKSLRRDLGVFSSALKNIYDHMPCPAIAVNLKTGEFEKIIDPDSQKRIDAVLFAEKEFVKTNYPEFYQP